MHLVVLSSQGLDASETVDNPLGPSVSVLRSPSRPFLTWRRSKAAASPRSRLRQASTTRAPRRASSSAVIFPMPLLAPAVGGQELSRARRPHLPIARPPALTCDHGRAASQAGDAPTWRGLHQVVVDKHVGAQQQPRAQQQRLHSGRTFGLPRRSSAARRQRIRSAPAGKEAERACLPQAAAGARGKLGRGVCMRVHYERPLDVRRRLWGAPVRKPLGACVPLGPESAL